MSEETPPVDEPTTPSPDAPDELVVPLDTLPAWARQLDPALFAAAGFGLATSLARDLDETTVK